MPEKKKKAPTSSSAALPKKIANGYPQPNPNFNPDSCHVFTQKTTCTAVIP